MNQKQILTLNGKDKGIVAYSDTNEAAINHAIAASSEDDGYHVIIGTDLDQVHPSARVASVVASNGILVFNALPSD